MRALHRDVLLERGSSLSGTIRTKPVWRKSPVASDVVPPGPEDLEALDGEVDLGRKAVVHPHERRGAAAAAAGDVALVEDEDPAGAPAREVERDRGAHDAGAEDHEVRGAVDAAAPLTRPSRSVAASSP